MLHVYSIFVWIMIKMQWFPLILNEKNTQTKPYFVYMKRFILFALLIYFYVELVLKFQFSFVIYICIIFTFCY